MSRILKLASAENLGAIGPSWLAGSVLNKEEFEHLGKLCRGFWVHNGDPKASHAELTSGKCSDGFINVGKLLVWSNLGSLLAQALLQEIVRRGDSPQFEWIVSSDHAGAALARDLGHLTGARNDFCEKVEMCEGTDTRPFGEAQKWARHTIGPGENVLHVEELVTTQKTLRLVREGIRGAHDYPVNFVPCVGVLVHRPDNFEDPSSGTFENGPIISPFRYEIRTWAGPEVCPLCKGGSKRLRPKANWDELTGGI